ncbi:hypothetical protein AGMMS49938_11240 [Fibrobacterales bacterium]|nr:hypothetical protein AGMMS49938_11240 [Fibrobacterales bacterium]
MYMDTITKKGRYPLAFIRGFASVFNLSGSLFIDVPDLSGGLERDSAMLKQDWIRIGGDIRNAMDKINA